MSRKYKEKVECEKCNELNKEGMSIYINEVIIDGWYYKWDCEINYCPKCGRKIEI